MAVAANVTRPPHWSRSAERSALVLFVAIELVAFPLMLWWGHRIWFAIDDWQFLTARTAGNVGDLFRPHFDHWVTLSVLAYRALWTLFGLRYQPYQMLVIALHLTAAALLRVVMRRAGVGPWLSTAAATVFVLFGSGAENVLVAFQIAFVGALVFGLTHLILADHDGPFDRRDWLGLVAGFCGLMCSAVAISMVGVVGLTVLWRRGWRTALIHTSPLAAAYGVWFAAVGHEQPPSLRSQPAATPASVTRFVLNGMQTTFAKLGYVPGIGIALFAMTVIGLILLFRRRAPSLCRPETVAPVALLVGAVAFLVVASIGRSGLANTHLAAPGRANALTATGRQSRYLHIVAAMSLPGIALAGQAIIQRWRKASIIVAGLLLVGIPGNLIQFPHFAENRSTITFATPTTRWWLLTVPRLQLAPTLPRLRQPDPFAAPGVTIGWLRDALRDGRLPTPARTSPSEVATLTLGLVLIRSRQQPSGGCVPLSRPLSRVMTKGQSFEAEKAPVSVTYIPKLGETSNPSLIPAGSERAVIAGPLRLRFAPVSQASHKSTPVLCF